MNRSPVLVVIALTAACFGATPQAGVSVKEAGVHLRLSMASTILKSSPRGDCRKLDCPRIRVEISNIGSGRMPVADRFFLESAPIPDESEKASGVFVEIIDERGARVQRRPQFKEPIGESRSKRAPASRILDAGQVATSVPWRDSHAPDSGAASGKPLDGYSELSRYYLPPGRYRIRAVYDQRWPSEVHGVRMPEALRMYAVRAETPRIEFAVE